MKSKWNVLWCCCSDMQVMDGGSGPVAKTRVTLGVKMSPLIIMPSVSLACCLQGRTSYSSPGLPESDYCVWSHPLDLHLASASSNNWPGLLVKVWGREVLLGRDR